MPWRQFLTSVPYWAIVASDTANNWGFNTFFLNGPTYLEGMLGVDIRTNGVLSGIPMLVRYVGGVFHAQIADKILEKHCMSVVNARRLFTNLAIGIPAVAITLIAFLGDTTVSFVKRGSKNFILMSCNGNCQADCVPVSGNHGHTSSNAWTPLSKAFMTSYSCNSIC